MFGYLILFALIILVETGINAGFLLNAHLAASPIAAITFSLLVSVTNVFFSVWAGFYIGRWRQYGAHAVDADNPEFVSIRRRAYWQFVACIIVWILLHSTLGLVRAQETLHSVEPSLRGYLSILTTPEALFLVLTGIGMSVLAYQKGMSAFSDRYPYYNQHHNAKENAYEATQETYAGFVAEIEERHADSQKALDHSWKAYLKEEEKVEKLLSRCLEARRELERTVDEAESALRTDIVCLAETHQAARGDKTPLPDAALNELASYQNFLEDNDPPALDAPPHFQDYRHAMDESKANALYELRGLFENLHDQYRGNSYEIPPQK
jgi:hypothetical protein